jgi:predicted kinase
VYAVLTGPPASGKSTLAAALATELGVPLLAKDTIKAGLVEALGAGDLTQSRQLGGAAVRALLAVARANAAAVLDSVWVDRDRAIADLADLPGPVVEVFCQCPRDLLEERYAARGTGLDRAVEERWNDATLTPLAGPWPLVEVDTSTPVDVLALAQRVLSDAGLALEGRIMPRPLDPVEPHVDLHLLARRGVEVAHNLAAGGTAPDPFGVVLTREGVPELVMPPRWMADPADWTATWGDLDELGPHPWIRGAFERIPHRAHVSVEVDLEAGVVRLQGEHRYGTRLEQTAPIGPWAP